MNRYSPKEDIKSFGPLYVLGWPMIIFENSKLPKLVRFIGSFTVLIFWFPFGAVLYIPTFLVWGIWELWDLTD